MTRVALVQVASPDEESRDERVARVERWLLSRAGEGIELFVLPELWSAGYQAFKHYEELAEPLTGPTISMCRRAAVTLDAWVHIGSVIERDDSGSLHNTAALINPGGEIVQIYRKIHVFGYKSREAQLLTPGDALSVVPGPLGPIASTTCYDLRFPGLWLELGARGAEVAVVPAAWPAARRDHFKLFTEARAVEHQIWILAVNACGFQSGVELGGCSRIVDPWGQVVLECSPDTEQIAVADLDPHLVDSVRAEFPVLGDRLPLPGYSKLS